MIPLMSITRNFFLGSEPTVGWGVLKRFDVAHARRVVRQELLKMGIDIRDPEQAVGTLSGGVRQSVAIARAVYFGAKVLILDEPTKGLDPMNRKLLLSVVEEYRQKGTAVIYITHLMEEVERLADKVLIIKDGKRMAYGTKDELKKTYGMKTIEDIFVSIYSERQEV